MRAWRIESHGGPEVLKRVEIPTPEPGPMEVRIKVEVVGLNHLDLWLQKGVPGHKFPLPITPGCDIAGRIEKFGPGSDQALAPEGLKLGSPVVLNPGISCGRCEACLGGFDPLCRHYGIIGEHRDGGCADFVVVPVTNVIGRPQEISANDAVALPINYMTAWSMLTRKVKLLPGETILIQAGGSAVSTAAIQMAKLLGAQVITTVGNDEKKTKARALGADHVINYKKSPFAEGVKKILAEQGKKGCDVVLDHVGTDTFQDSLKCLAWGGRFVTCGATSGSQVTLDLKAVFFKNLSILGSTMGSKADLLRILELVRQGKLKAVIDTALPMKDLPLAFSRIESRVNFGKVLLTSD